MSDVGLARFCILLCVLGVLLIFPGSALCWLWVGGNLPIRVLYSGLMVTFSGLGLMLVAGSIFGKK